MSTLEIPPPPGLQRNLPCAEGAALGEHLARFAAVEAEKHPDMPEPCGTCAFRLGTFANTSMTAADALKCAMERKPFFCHEKDHLCHGWRLLTKDAGPPVECPWPFVTTPGKEQVNACYYCGSFEHQDAPCPNRHADAERFASGGKKIYPSMFPATTTLAKP